jgi:hypothetical protein
MSHARLEVRMESLLPFLQGTRTPYNMPVYPGAQRIIACALTDDSCLTSRNEQNIPLQACQRRGGRSYAQEE